MPFSHTPTIELTTHRCTECGRYYAVESFPSSRCPYCGDKRAVERMDEIERLGRVIRALRGALTRRGKRT